MLITAAEVMISITCLEFSYTQSPRKMKSFVMAIFLLSVSAGNIFTALVNRFTRDEFGNSQLDGASYYWFFTAAMAIAAVLFIGVAKMYRGKTYLQEEVAQH
jgi:POT family proton-dependent oligopeptide transporter